MNVLIVEPSPELAEVLQVALNQRGITSRVAGSAQLGIRLADENPPQLVLLELVVPRHNGMEFLHEFRSYPDWLDIPIILYTNVSRDELQLEGQMLQDMGIAGYFYKPTTSLEKLVGAVESKIALYHN